MLTSLIKTKSDILSQINVRLTHEDDPAFWSVAVSKLLADTSLFIPGDFDSHNIFIQIGACSHWLRPHQTRLTGAGGFALPAGYLGSGWSRLGLPEFDWQLLLHWDFDLQDWRLVTKYFGKRKLVRRLALPTRTRRHNQAAIHAMWSPGSPRHPNKKRTEYFGFRKIGGMWKRVLPADLAA